MHHALFQYISAMANLSLQAFFNRRKKLLYGLGAVVGLFVLFDDILLPWYVYHGSRLYVPKVVGMTLANARQVLEASSLQAVEAETRPDPIQPAGTVVYQNPLPNAVVKVGRRVYLSISGGEVQVTVPSLRGKSMRDARFALEQYGLKLGSVSYTPSDSYPENTIVEQTVAPDSRITRGMVVGITVSRGRVQQETAVPQVVGKTMGEAEKLLTAAGLKVGNITYQPSFDLLPNTVVDQFPRVGEPARPGQEVDLFVVKVGKLSEEIQNP